MHMNICESIQIMMSHLAVSLPSFKLKELPAEILQLPKAQNYLFMGIVCLI